MHDLLHQWAADWGFDQYAVLDLLTRLGMGYEPQRFKELEGWSEAAVQSHVRIEAAKAGIYAWRNNVGALADATGRIVRYGLCNDSKEMNQKVKSSDLIGIKKEIITLQMVGQTFGRFWGREVKEDGWKYTGTDHERAQAKFGQIVTAAGGDWAFTTGAI